MIDWVAKVQARGGDMDAPKRIWAWTFKDCDWKSAWTVADEDAPPHATAYVRADLAARDLAELVEAMKGIAPLVDCDVPGEPDEQSIGWQNGNEPIPVTFGQVRAFFAALAKIKEQTK